MKLYEFKERPNQHQTHFEDLVLLGQDGLEELNDKIDKLIELISENTQNINLTTKVDGAPAVVLFSNFDDYPTNSICLKSFITSNKNCLSSVEEIENKYGDRPDMAEKLKYCLELSKCIPAGEAWQGDCLYTRSTLKEVEINGINYLTFHPNKIVYAVSKENESYNEIKNSNFGICFHTIYHGNLEHKTQSFNINLNNLINVPSDIYVMSPALSIPSDRSLYNLDEINKLYDKLKNVESKLFINPDYEALCNNLHFMTYWNTFENYSLADKKSVNINEETFYSELVDYIETKKKKEFEKKIAGLKTEKGIESATNKFKIELAELEEILENNKEVITQLVKALNLAANIKMVLWTALRQSKQDYSTFYQHREQGYIPADIEGVALSDQEGNIVKLVDRSSFSSVNRDSNYLSGFEHNESLEESIDWFSFDD